MTNCENCVHARITTGRTVIMKNGTMIIQQTTPGGKNITCCAGAIKQISFIDDKMYCSSCKAKDSESSESSESNEDSGGNGTNGGGS